MKRGTILEYKQQILMMKNFHCDVLQREYLLTIQLQCVRVEVSNLHSFEPVLVKV